MFFHTTSNEADQSNTLSLFIGLLRYIWSHDTLKRRLNDNKLTKLADGVFDQLGSLRYL